MQLEEHLARGGWLFSELVCGGDLGSTLNKHVNLLITHVGVPSDAANNAFNSS
jgi:hypothetical protein